MTPEDARRWVEAELEGLEAVDCCGGKACVFTTRSPEKATPNEDAAAIIPVDERRGVLAVADGVGGARGGAQASSTAIYELYASLETFDVREQSMRGAILDGIESADREVRLLGIGAATTIAVAEIGADYARPYHVGDSQILVLSQRGTLRAITLAHSPVGYAEHAGLLDEEEALIHNERHFVSNLVGVPGMTIEVGQAIELRPRDTLVLGSDGLFDNLTRREIVDTLRTGGLEESVAALIERCRTRMRDAGAQPSKPDDLTVIAFRRP